jgi:hypothetical protein
MVLPILGAMYLLGLCSKALLTIWFYMTVLLASGLLFIVSISFGRGAGQIGEAGKGARIALRDVAAMVSHKASVYLARAVGESPLIRITLGGGGHPS